MKYLIIGIIILVLSSCGSDVNKVKVNNEPQNINNSDNLSTINLDSSNKIQYDIISVNNYPNLKNTNEVEITILISSINPEEKKYIGYCKYIVKDIMKTYKYDNINIRIYDNKESILFDEKFWDDNTLNYSESNILGNHYICEFSGDINGNSIDSKFSKDVIGASYYSYRFTYYPMINYYNLEELHGSKRRKNYKYYSYCGYNSVNDF